MRRLCSSRHVILLGIAILGAGAASDLFAAEAARPNIVFLFSDDQTERAVGCYGNKDVITPNLDRLAREGVRFTNHYNTTSICMASRCSVMTGLYEYRHGCNFGHGDLERRFMDQSYPVLLRKAGYATELDAMRRHYDAGLAAVKANVVQGHGHEAYPILFDRSVAWEEKAPLLKAARPKGGDEDESPAGKTNGRRRAAK